MRRLFVGIIALTTMAVAAPAQAADGITLSGTAKLKGNKVELVSDFSDASAARCRAGRRWRR